MTYSFIQPQKRKIFNLFAKIWLALFVFAISFILGVCFIYNIKIKLTQDSINDKKEEIISIEEQTVKTNELYEVLLEQSRISKNFAQDNQDIKEGLKNLFGIIVKTDGITLDSVEQNENSLRLTGISPTKEMFTLLLETPLRSIFDESYTSYYELDNGWYRFVNVNTKQDLGEYDERQEP